MPWGVFTKSLVEAGEGLISPFATPRFNEKTARRGRSFLFAAVFGLVRASGHAPERVEAGRFRGSRPFPRNRVWSVGGRLGCLDDVVPGPGTPARSGLLRFACRC